MMHIHQRITNWLEEIITQFILEHTCQSIKKFFDSIMQTSAIFEDEYY